MAKKIRKVILAIALLAVLASCESKPFKGIIVCKEYVKAHYVQRPRQAPQLVPSEWKFYVANKYAVREFSVDSITYTKHHVGERIIMRGNE
ncbi:hypothetical protein [Hoylesella shahii]|uniref:hypothetical protein n=1 Tax=Hoylesella shahii TaxID=228603 RepID=UPI0028E53052|nr:hypothetical protein [Hoylesella shahii]